MARGLSRRLGQSIAGEAQRNRMHQRILSEEGLSPGQIRAWMNRYVKEAKKLSLPETAKGRG